MSTTTADVTITRTEFVSRFVAEMVRVVGPDMADGPTREYAEEIAVTYWDEPSQREEGPEECARADVSYWEP